MGTVILWAIGSISPAWPHGFAGNRIFPTTFGVDDPFVMDEFSMLASHLREAGTANVTGLLGTGLSADYTARIPDTHLGLVIGGEYRNVIPDGGDAMHGFGNLVVGTKYQFFTSNRHETIASIGLDAAIGNTGDQSLGAEGFSVILPYLAIGKGMGDLPKSLPWLKPFAITSQFGGAVPTDNRIAWSDVPPSDLTSRSATGIPTKLPWGFTIQEPRLPPASRPGCRPQPSFRPTDPGGGVRHGKLPGWAVPGADQRHGQSGPHLVRRLHPNGPGRSGPRQPAHPIQCGRPGAVPPVRR
jgi:hypothetical protein